MQLISFASFKGGAGKSTALMAVAGGLVEQGKRVALIEADDNAPLRGWRQNAIDNGTWSDACEIFEGADEPDFEQAYEKASDAGFDVALVDTHGGGSDLNNLAMSSSELIVVPTALTSLDVDTTLETMEYIADLWQQNQGQGANAPAGILIQRHPTGRMAHAEKLHLDVLSGLPQFEVKMHERRAFADIKMHGMLHLYRDQLAEHPGKRVMARHIGTAAAEAVGIAKDLLASM